MCFRYDYQTGLLPPDISCLGMVRIKDIRDLIFLIPDLLFPMFFIFPDFPQIDALSVLDSYPVILGFTVVYFNQ